MQLLHPTLALLVEQREFTQWVVSSSQCKLELGIITFWQGSCERERASFPGFVSPAKLQIGQGF
jgi:hypothetical protein